MNDIRADFVFESVPGIGAKVKIDVQKGLSKAFAVSPTGGFEYHIHVKPVGPNDDCMATGGHLDPANVGATKCDPIKADKCQEGDLSGKHGELKATESGQLPTVSYVDHQVQFSGSTTTIEGRSIVIHNNGSRVACGDILPVGAPRTSNNASNGSSGSIDSTSLNGGQDTPSSVIQSNDGRTVGWNAATIVAVMVGMLGAVLVF
ncbi:hypothetical protein BGZ46_008806 [Entomortierella lignicola]|nr:hypothetical protein BGZ46_008806 [Entomortierella lignicola]